MANVSGQRGAKIESLMNQASDEWNKGNYDMNLTLLERAWDELPDSKNEYDESFLIIWRILNTSILVGDHARLRKWVDKIFTADPERRDTGERDMWAGRVAYVLGEFVEAKGYFEAADKKSKGRCFSLKDDRKYYNFYKNLE